MAITLHPALISPSLVHELRLRDYRRFLAIQRAPAATRPALYALTAYYNELAYVTESASDPAIAAIRFAWWREGVEALASGKPPREHPAMQAIAGLLSTGLISSESLLSLISARAVELDAALLRNEEQFYEYLDNTSGALHLLWLKLLGIHEQALLQPTMQLSRAYALLGLLLAIPHYTSRNQQRFAADMLQPNPPQAQLQAFVQTHFVKATTMLEQSWVAPHALPKPLRVLHAFAKADATWLKNACFNPEQALQKGRSPLRMVWLALTA